MIYFIIAVITVIAYFICLRLLQKKLGKGRLRSVIATVTTLITIVGFAFSIYQGIVQTHPKGETDPSETAEEINITSNGDDSTIISGDDNTIISGDNNQINIYEDNPSKPTTVPNDDSKLEQQDSTFSMVGINDEYETRVNDLLAEWVSQYEYYSVPPTENNRDYTLYSTDIVNLSIGLVDYFWLAEGDNSFAHDIPLRGVTCAGKLIAFPSNEVIAETSSNEGNIVFVDIPPGDYYYCVEAFGYNTRYSQIFQITGAGEDIIRWSVPISQINTSAFLEPYLIQLVDSNGTPETYADIYITSNYEHANHAISYSPFATDKNGFVCYRPEINGREYYNLCLFSSLDKLELIIAGKNVSSVLATFYPKENQNNLVSIK